MKLITNTRLTAGTCESLTASFEITELVLVRRKHAFDTSRQVNVFGLRPA